MSEPVPGAVPVQRAPPPAHAEGARSVPGALGIVEPTVRPS
ncbi:hypothetical protein ACFY9A_03620 [Streptomyces rubradiris]